jgi:alanyl-tRNA synthetase
LTVPAVVVLKLTTLQPTCLQAALKQIVDPSISQAGSLVAFDRLRFDFHCSRPLTPEEVQQIEEQVNTWIAEAHTAEVAVMPIAEAKAKGAIAMFGRSTAMRCG